MENERKVAVKSMVKYRVGLEIPDLRFSRVFATENEVKNISFETLLEGMNSLGVRTLFEEGILYIENKKDRVDLGLQEEEDTEKFKVLNRGQILKLLKVDSPKKLEEVIKNMPKEQILRITDIAIEEKITDYDKGKILKAACGIDVIESVKNNEAD